MARLWIINSDSPILVQEDDGRILVYEPRYGWKLVPMLTDQNNEPMPVEEAALRLGLPEVTDMAAISIVLKEAWADLI